MHGRMVLPMKRIYALGRVGIDKFRLYMTELKQPIKVESVNIEGIPEPEGEFPDCRRAYLLTRSSSRA